MYGPNCTFSVKLQLKNNYKTTKTFVITNYKALGFIFLNINQTRLNVVNYEPFLCSDRARIAMSHVLS